LLQNENYPDMENKLQELTRKIYSEGVEKANQEAALILGMHRKRQML